MKKTVILIITMTFVMMGQCFAQNFQKMDSLSARIIALNGTDTVVNNHRITVVSGSDTALIRIYPLEGVIQQFSIKWQDSKLYSFNNRSSIGEASDKTILFDGTVFVSNGIVKYYLPSKEGDITINRMKYIQMEEHDKAVIDRALNELVNHITQLP